MAKINNEQRKNLAKIAEENLMTARREYDTQLNTIKDRIAEDIVREYELRRRVAEIEQLRDLLSQLGLSSRTSSNDSITSLSFLSGSELRRVYNERVAALESIPRINAVMMNEILGSIWTAETTEEAMEASSRITTLMEEME